MPIGTDLQLDPAALVRHGGRVDAGDDVRLLDELRVVQAGVDVCVRAELLDRLNRHLDPRLGAVHYLERLGPEAEDDAAVDLPGRLAGEWDLVAVELRAPVGHRHLLQVHRGGADESRDEHVRRMREEHARLVHLLQLAAVEDGDPVAHRHRLDLVVRDVHRRDPEPALQRRDLRPRLNPQLRIEVREWLVEQEHVRLAHDRAPHRDPLALPPRKGPRLPAQVLLEVEHLRRLGDAISDLGFRDVRQLEREADVLRHGHVGVERVVLEDHRHVAQLRRQVGDVAVADPDAARVDILEPGEHPQAGRLAAPGRPDEDEKLAVGDVECEPVNRGALCLREDPRCLVVPDCRHLPASNQRHNCGSGIITSS